MIDELINLLIELAVNPDAQISEEMLGRYQITDDALRSALLTRDKQALMRFLDAKNRSPLESHNNSTIYSIGGQIETEAPGLIDGLGPIPIKLKAQQNYELILINKHNENDAYVAKVQSGELEGLSISWQVKEGGSEGETPIYSIGGYIVTDPPKLGEGLRPILFTVQLQQNYELILINTKDQNDAYVAKGQSGELEGLPISWPAGEDSSEGETSSQPPG